MLKLTMSIQSLRKTAFCFFFLLLLPIQSHSSLTIEISEGYDNAIPIAIIPFGFEQKQVGKSEALPADLAQIVGADLRRSGHFKPLAKKSLPSLPNMLEQVDYADWRSTGVDNMLIGKLVYLGNDRYQVDVRFLDVLRRKQVFGKRWVDIPKANLRQIAHQISDLIYEELTGVRGAFNTQIAYVTMHKEGSKRRYTLEVADSDGHNAQPILKSTQPILSPAWSPDGKKIAYVSFENDRSEVFIQSLDGQYREKIASFKGINGAPAFSPDGKQLALTLSKAGNADIYIMDLATKKLKQITRKHSIETEAAWAANGRSLFFNSDRRGQPQVFQVFLDTGEERRLTFDGKYNGNPEVSPDGRHISVVHGQGGFHIGLLDLYTGDFKVLTNTFLDESPSFAPNGEMILYAMNQGGKGKLAVVSVDGNTSQVLSVKDGEVREPAWGPFIQY